jgi:hypothetical protein
LNPTFHINQLNKQLDPVDIPSPNLPLFNLGGTILTTPHAIQEWTLF